MVRKRRPLPSENDLVICTISKVFSHGAFAKLDEYGGKEGFIHISEVASTWIKNIRDFVRPGQKSVAKVLSVNPAKGHIDLSLRRVGEAQRKNKTHEWKRVQKADKLLELTAKEVGKTLDDAYTDVGFKLEDEFGEIYSGFEEISMSGESALDGLAIPKVWIKPLVRIVRENVVIPSVAITGYLDLKCYLFDGVDVIKESLMSPLKEVKDVELDVKYTKSPRFSVTVRASDYKTAEEALKGYATKAISIISAKGGTGQFVREKS
ncbi:MAG: translation initiation factor IF-2 subunit alpha [Candidatus Hydrothermarchaeaceae archaeon]